MATAALDRAATTTWTLFGRRRVLDLVRATPLAMIVAMVVGADAARAGAWRRCCSTSSAAGSAARPRASLRARVLPAAGAARSPWPASCGAGSCAPRPARSTRSSRRSGLGALRQDWLGDPSTALPSGHGACMIWVQIGYPSSSSWPALQRVDPELLRGGRARRRQLVAAVPAHHPAADPPRDLRGAADLHDRRAQGVRPGLRAHARRPGNATIVPGVLRLPELLQASPGRLRLGHLDRAHAVIVIVAAVFIWLQNRGERAGPGEV